MSGSFRRGLLCVGSAALLLPMLGRADDGPDDPDPRRIEVGATAIGGRTRYTLCGVTHEVAFVGASAAVQGGGPGGPSYRAELGGAITRSRQVEDEDGPISDPDAAWEPSFYTFGQVGEDWRYFGFLIGGGVGSLEDVIPLPALTLRVGPRRPFRVDVHFLDYAPLQRGLAGAEAVFFPNPRIEMALGARFLFPAESPTATFRVDFPIGNGLRMGILGGGAVMAGEFVGQGELAVRAAL